MVRVKREKIITKFLNKVYNTPSNPGSFGGVQSLFRAVKDQHFRYKISKNEIIEFLKGKDEYTLHKPLYRNFRTEHVVMGGINDHHEGDLLIMGEKYSKYNDGYTYLLTIIDCFTKMAFITPLKTKNSKDMIYGLEKTYTNRDTPNTFRSDQGKEFMGNTVQKLFKTHNISFTIAVGTHKAFYIERFIRTIKSHISRYMTLNNTLRYIDVLPDILVSYNNRYHNSTGYKPVDVNDQNAKEVFERLNGSPITWFENLDVPKFKKDDHVRVSRLKGLFEKGYEENYTREVFKIFIVLNTKPRQYKIKSLNNQPVKGRFYEKELTSVIFKPDSAYQIEKVIKHRVLKGKKQVYVKWKGWDKSYNQWIAKDQLIDA